MSEPQTEFAVQRIYVKDLSFESPKAPNSFRLAARPKIKLDLSARNSSLGDDLHEVVIGVTVTASDDNDEVIYLVELQQAGAFLLRGFTEDDLAHAVSVFCPGVLFPYARESVDALVTRGGFPPLQLAHISFDAVYQQAKAQRDANADPVQ